MKRQQVWAKNRTSPYNENDYIESYKKVIPEALKTDNYDIAAVVTADGINGHALMYYVYNRSHDSQLHLCKWFVSDDELRLYM